MEFDHHTTAMVTSNSDGPAYCATCGSPLGRSSDWTWRHLGDDGSQPWHWEWTYEDLVGEVAKEIQRASKSSGNPSQNGTIAPQDCAGVTQTHLMEVAAKVGVQGLYKFTVSNLGGTEDG